MRTEINKPIFDVAKAAWKKQLLSAPRLEDAWFKKTVIEIVSQPREAVESNYDMLWGFALSAAVSVAIFISSNMFGVTSYSSSYSYAYLLDISPIDQIVGE